MINHYPTCMVWSSGHASDCNCAGQKPWKILRTGGDHPWQILRRTGSLANGWGIYEPFMSCRSHRAALQMVDGMIWLGQGKGGLRSDV